MSGQSRKIKRLVLAAACLALGYLLPFLTGNNFVLGQMLSPMHIPALLCGFLCGWPYGLAVGAVMPLMRFVLVGAPPLHTAIIMAFELATYGAMAGLLYARLRGKRFGTVIALVAAMLTGRVVGGLVSIPVLSIFAKNPITFAAFWTNYFLTPWPAIVVQLLVVPSVVHMLEAAKIMSATEASK